MIAVVITLRAQAQNSFTYQGRLTSNGNPAAGVFDLRFRLSSDADGNNFVGSPVLTNGMSVADGLVSASLDFGAVFNGSNFWLQVEVRTNGASGYTVLAPLQPLTAVPYALYAMTPAGPKGDTGATGPPGPKGDTGDQGPAGASPFSLSDTNAFYVDGFVGIGTNDPATALSVHGTVTATSFAGDGAELTELDGSAIASGTITGSQLASGSVGNSQLANNAVQAANIASAAVTSTKIADGTIAPADLNMAGFDATFWRANGNAGTTPGTHFLGTTDDQPLEFRVNAQRALRIEPGTNDSPNVIAGSSLNYVSNSVVGATIAGGGTTNFTGLSLTNHVTSSYGTVGGGLGNSAEGFAATVAGGLGNISGLSGTVSGGLNNNAGYAATVGGGSRNSATNFAATVSGGFLNDASGLYATVAGGYENIANDQWGTISGGYSNTVSASRATVAGGSENIASGVGATIGGGLQNTASGAFSFAAGARAQALHEGSFVWSDHHTTGLFASTADNQFSVRAVGGVRLIGNVQIGEGGGDYRHLLLGGGNSSGFLYGSFPKFADGIHLSYNYYADVSGANHVANTGGGTSRLTVGYSFVGIYVGGVNAAPTTQRLLANATGVTVNGTFNNSSDRNAKQDFEDVSASDMLDKVLQLPVSEWSYKEDSTTRHIGPVAQDFHAAFNIGTDDKHIAPMDEGGIAFAAIQGLHQKLTTELHEKQNEISELKQRLERLERMLEVQVGESGK